MTRIGAAVLVASFAVLAFSAAPGLYLRDSGELTTAAFTLGVAHETGFSLWCLGAKLATLVPIGEVATRVNFFSAASGALAAWLIFLLVRAVGEGARAAEVAGAGAAALLIGGLTFFKSSTVAEVYAPTAAAIALALWLAHRAANGSRAAGPLLALVGGLSLGLHAQLRILVGPACAAWALWRLRRGDRWPLFAPVALALGAAVVVYLPLRAAREPAADWAHPTTLGALFDHLSAARIRRAFTGEIFSRDGRAFVAHLAAFARLVEGQLGVPALLAAAGGFAWLLRRRATRLVGGLALAIAFGDALYSAWINPMGLDDLQDGAPTALALAFAAGAGLYAAALRLGGAPSENPAEKLGARAAPWIAGALAVGIALPAALAGGRALGPEAASWTRAALAAAPPRALALTTSDDLSAGFLYEQSVAGARPDVTALVRQQLWDGALYAERVARAGGEVRGLDAFRARGDRERIAHEPELLRALVHHELGARAIVWEPGGDAPPEGALEPGVPVYQLLPAAAPLPAVRPLAESVEKLLQPGRDPLARRLAATSLSSLGRIYLERGDDARAGGLFEAALGVRPNDAVAATNLAVVRARRGDFAGARALVEDVLRRDPDRQVARLNSARYRLALGDLDGAAGDFQLAHAHAPGDPAPLIGLARIALRKNDRAAARRYLADALARAPGDGEARALERQLSSE